jgi:cobalamin biosynthesis protein CobD/CbiB
MLALPSRISRSLIKARNGKTSTITLGVLLCCILLRIATASRSSVLPPPVGSIIISRLILYTTASRACFCLEDLYVSRLLEERLSTFRTAISRLASLLRAS